MSRLRNIIIFVCILLLVAVGYFFFLGRSAPEPSLVSTGPQAIPSGAGAETSNPITAIGQDFLATLLSVRSIKLDDSLFLDPAYLSLKDSSITLFSDGNEGRINPFAPLGRDALPPPSVAPGTAEDQ